MLNNVLLKFEFSITNQSLHNRCTHLLCSFHEVYLILNLDWISMYFVADYSVDFGTVVEIVACALSTIFFAKTGKNNRAKNLTI